MKKTAAATQWAGLVKHPYRPPCSCTWVEEGWSVWLLVGKRVARLFLHLLLVLGTHSAHHMGRMTCCVPSFTLFLKLGWKFYDADDYHPEENRMKMQKGIPLNDEVRCTVCFYFQRMSQPRDAGEDACTLGAVEFLSHALKTVLQKPGAQQACHVCELWP